MGLDPWLTREEIQRIEIEADNENQGPTEPAVLSVKKKKRVREKMTSDVWNHFKKGPVQDDGSYTATCMYCGIVYIMGNQKSTSSLRHHIRQGCKKMPSEKRQKQDPLQKFLQKGSTSGGSAPAIWEFDQTRCRKSFAKMVIVHEYPFNCVNHRFMKIFLNDVQPRFKLVSRNTLRADCMKIYEEEKNSLYGLLAGLDSKISFTSELWTSNNGNRGFISLTCHFIDDTWKLRKRMLVFCSLPSPHTGKDIADAIFQMLLTWNLDKKIFSLTLDNTSSNDACIRELMTTQLKMSLPVQGRIFHQRCAYHILNLIVQDGLAMISDKIHKIRETMKYLRHSQARNERFQLAASQVNVPYKTPAWDDPTRWNSTYIMLELGLQLKPAIVRYAALDEEFNFKLGSEEWDEVDALVECLKVFYDATLKMSGTKYPTLNLFFTEFCEVFLAIKGMDSSSYPFIVDMGKVMFAKWDKYWTTGNFLLALACILDPRQKMRVIEYYTAMMYPDQFDPFIANLKCCLNELYKEYLRAPDSGLSSPRTSSQAGSTHLRYMPSSSVSNTRAGLKDFMRGFKSSEPTKTEVDEYLDAPLDDASLDEDFDIIAWWKLNSPKYPVLARVARDILAVPISAVASEATFSISSRTLSPVRSSLNIESIEALICAQDWLRSEIIETVDDVGESLSTLWSSATEVDGNAADAEAEDEAELQIVCQ